MDNVTICKLWNFDYKIMRSVFAAFGVKFKCRSFLK